MRTPSRILKAMRSLQEYCYSVRCSECPNLHQCHLGDELYSHTDYRLISDRDIARAEKREPKATQMSLFGG